MRHYNILFLCVFVLKSALSSTCPNDCNIRGICTTEGTCVCDTTSTGADCGQILCPKDKAWSGKAYSFNNAHDLIECASNGLCDYSKGICQCFPGYEGAACQRLICGDCNNNGVCMTIGRLYDEFTIVKPTDLYTGWDVDETTMCVCDYGYTGSKCEMRMCPKGNDPLTTYTDYRTVIITTSGASCTNGGSSCVLSGVFTFSFDDQYFTFPADSNDWSEDLCTAAFESLPNIDLVKCTQGLPSLYGGTTYTVNFYTWPVLPFQNNIYFHNGYPALSAFGCSTSGATTTGGVSVPSCTVSDVVVNTYPGE